jgi:hypothetical protein
VADFARRDALAVGGGRGGIESEGGGQVDVDYGRFVGDQAAAEGLKTVGNFDGDVAGGVAAPE